MLRLIYEFFKTGLFSIGGGLATIPFLAKMGETFGYFTQDELLTMIAVSESTPGPIGINMATFAGIKAGGILYGVIAPISLVFPSLIIVIMIAKLIEKYRKSPYMKNILKTLKPVSIGFIAAAIIPIYISLFKEVRGSYILGMIAIMTIVFFLREKLNKLHPGFIILGAFIIGIIFDFVKF